MTLVAANLVILASISALLYTLLAKACDRLTATAAGLVFLGLFGFSQYVSIGNYNFVCPYSHEATHGVLFAIGMVFFLARFALTPSWPTAALAGLSFGLTLLTRSEVALAAAAAAAVGLGLALLCQDSEGRRPGQSVLAFSLGALAPAAAAFLLFLTSLPVPEAATAVAGAWMPLVRSDVTRNAFFQEGMGLDTPGDNLTAMLLASAMLLGVVALLAGADFVLSRGHAHGRGFAPVAAILTLIAARSLPAVFRWQALGRVLTVTSLAATVAMVVYAIRKRGSDTGRSLVGLAGFCTLALVLLGKMALNPRLYQYGFYLAMPATLVLVCGVLWAIPSALRARWGGGLVFRAGAGGLVVAAVVFYLERSNQFYREKDFVVGEGGDAILDYRPRIEPRAEAVRQALQRVETLVPPDGTLVAMPEGVMINYLTRRANPTPYTTFMPTELAVYGEPAVLASLKATPPDYVLLVHKDTREFGVGYFGADPRYGTQIMEWVRSQYDPIEVIQHEPLVSRRFGIKIMKRRQLAIPPVHRLTEMRLWGPIAHEAKNVQRTRSVPARTRRRNRRSMPVRSGALPTLPAREDPCAQLPLVFHPSSPSPSPFLLRRSRTLRAGERSDRTAGRCASSRYGPARRTCSSPPSRALSPSMPPRGWRASYGAPTAVARGRISLFRRSATYPGSRSAPPIRGSSMPQARS